MPPREDDKPPAPWRVFIDTGGTFTDCLGLDPDGQPHRAKVLSSAALRATVEEVDPDGRLRLGADWLDRAAFASGAGLASADGGESRARLRSVTPDGWAILDDNRGTFRPGDMIEISTGEEAPILGARVLTRTPANRPLPSMDMRLATTRATNALLERRGEPPVFFVTEGFADLLRIGDQTRPDLFSLRIDKPPPLHGEVVEVPGRLDAAGRELAALDLRAVRARAALAIERGARVAAVALLHAWRNPTHELAVRDLLHDAGFEHVSISSALGASIGLLDRAETAVANAYLAPVIETYLDRVERALSPGSRLWVMTSAGGLADRDRFAPKDSLLSGPAGGVVGAAESGRRAGYTRVISFDMGGTSTDCARTGGHPERVYRTRVGDARIVAPAVAVETVAAGGGSICSIDRGEMRVGPESAGAEPGPACYGRGGPLTLTDCNLLLGRVHAQRFAVPLRPADAKARADQLLREAGVHLGASMTMEALLSGFIEIADQRMAEAVRRITIRKGHDPSEHALVAFGGAGPQHACAIAAALGVREVLVPDNAGVLSAFGLAAASPERVAARQILRPLDEVAARLGPWLEEIEHEATGPLEGRGPARVLRTLDLRLVGQDDVLELDAEPVETLSSRFTSRYRASFGALPIGAIEVVEARVTAARPSQTPDLSPELAASDSEAETARVFTATAGWREAPALARSQIAEPVAGPALVFDAHCSIWVEPGWEVEPSAGGALRLRHVKPVASPPGRVEAVALELGAGKLEAIALEMGERLRRTALSVNVKSRRDFSCAVLDARGRLVVNAPHVPVHLGSLGVCVRAVRAALGPTFGDPRGATVVTNHPAFGGSHLPDVTVIHPVIDDAGCLIAYTACRAHHAEIGGIAPGSMAPEASTLAEEGVVIPPTAIGAEASFDWDCLEPLFRQGPLPSRAPEINRRDLAAAIHAVWGGAGQVRREIGAEDMRHIGDRILARAADRVRAALRRLGERTSEHRHLLDDGTPICVRVEVRGENATIDFTGTGPVHPRCLNATPAIATSAVVYVLRLLVNETLPLNEGLLDPVRLVIPESLLNPSFDRDPSRCPAVAGGNVEISQAVTETLIAALGLAAPGQTTMNNVVFGNDHFGFYETLGGGSGAGPGFDGADAVHSHMTNTALTDPELLEHRHPVRLVRCAIRRGSGGRGTRRGGDGMIREYEFLDPVRVSILAQSRVRGPQGQSPENAGDPGVDRLLAPSGHWVSLGAAGVDAVPGQILRISTPGAAGFSE